MQTGGVLMKNSTKITLTLTTVCAGVSIYMYLKNKERQPLATFSEDFYDEVKDGALDEDLIKDLDKKETILSQDYVI